ncbi:MAG: rhodanese-like domain-containing protein [Oscillospiraceae bacterium]|nr:rhodanese-like domain-containing protein [Oscillospiraceae bacterium]
MKKLILVILFFPLLLVACNNDSAQEEQSPSPTPEPTPVNGSGETVYRRISAGDAHQMMQDTSEYILLDVRRIDEFNAEHIEGAILIPYDEIGNRAADELPDKNALILIYCRSGRRSELAARELIGMGYTNVYDFGGILDWPYDTIKG